MACIFMELPQIHQLMAENLRSPIWVYDIIGHRILWANDAALCLWEAESLTELCQRDFSIDQSRAVKQTLLGYLDQFRQHQTIDVWWEIVPKGIKKKVFCRLSGILAEIAGESRMVMLLEGQYSSELLNCGGLPSAAMAVLFDQQGNIISMNPPFVEQFGEALTNLEDILPEESGVYFISTPLSMRCDIELNTQRGMRWHHAEVKIQKETSQQTYYVLTLIDIQDRKLRDIAIANEDHSDQLTGLLNRRGLLQYMSSHQGDDYTLFYIDLDGFKPINDSYGHNLGDQLLRHVANVLVQQPGRKVCSRLGGDEFLLVLFGRKSGKEIQEFSNNLLFNIYQPCNIEKNYAIQISGSIGISFSPNNSDDINELMMKADAAMYEAKKLGRNRAVIYKEGMESYLQRRTQILKYIDTAIMDNKFNIVYQPIVNGLNGEVVLVEVLLRWQHPVLGDLSPLELIAVAEDCGKIAKLESWVIRQVCRDFNAIRQYFSDNVKVTLNISGAHLIQPGFIKKILCLLAEYGCKPDDFLLELTESVLVPMVEDKNPCLNELVAAGFKLAIDDFGTGYSSLAYINQLPASYVKIDKAFVDQLHHEKNTLLFIRDLCQNFNMQCIAEGVEQQSQQQILNDVGIHLQQGYYFFHPQPLTSLIATTQCLPEL